MKKLLFVSTLSSVFHEPMLSAFRELNFLVEVVDYRGNWVLEVGNPAHRLIGRLPGSIARRLKVLAQWYVDRVILAAAKRFHPDFIFVSKAKEISTDILDELRTIATTLNYYPETMDHWDTIKKLAPHYDYFLNYDSYVVNLLSREGIHNALYVPFSADVASDAQWSDRKEYLYNISFVGSFHPVRYAEREQILSRVKDLGLHIWGNRAWEETSLRGYYHGRPSTEEMLEIYRNSRIVINIDLLSSIGGIGVNLRPFEITSAGALLVNHDDRKDIFNLFQDGKEFVSFRGPDDIREKIAYYLNNEQERARIAKAGFEHTRDVHTYAARFRDVFSHIELRV